MSEEESKSIHDIHLGFVEQLKARGEQVVQPRGEPTGHIKGYDKTIGLISAGTIAVSGSKEDFYLPTFDLIQDHFTHAYTGVKWEDIGLCDAKCWYEAIGYEAIEDQRQERVKANKEYAGKQADDLPWAELPLLKQEYIIEILSGIIDEIHHTHDIEDAHTYDRNNWKQDFINGLKIPRYISNGKGGAVDLKRMLGKRNNNVTRDARKI